MSGLSSEIFYKDEKINVQTEDKGRGAAYVESLVYHKGKIVHSRKGFYSSFLGDPNVEARILKLLQEQHQALLDDITAGRLDHHLFKARP